MRDKRGNDMQNSYERKITARSLIRFALPTVIANIFFTVYSTVDGVFVSRFVGESALSAINIVYPFLMFGISVGTMLGTGGSALVAKLMGAGDERGARSVFSLILATGLAASVAISALGLAFMDPVLRFLGSDGEILSLCRDYATPIFVMLPSAMLGSLFQVFFITDGRPKLGMLFGICGGVVNIVLDYVFILRFGWGLLGASIATGLGYSLPAVTGIVYFVFLRRGSLYFVRPVPNGRALLQACSNGVSEMVTQMSGGVIIVMFNNIMMALEGVSGVAAITIILYAQMLLSSAFIGISFGVAPLISFNYGREDRERLRQIHRIVLRVIGVIGVMTFGIGLVAAKPLVGVFAPEGTRAFELADGGFFTFSFAFLLMGFNIYASSFFTALNNGKVSAILSFCRTLLFLSVCLAVLPRFLGVTGVWLAIPVAEILSAIVSFGYLKSMKVNYGYA